MKLPAMKMRVKTQIQARTQTPTQLQTIRLRSWIALCATAFVIGLLAFAPARLFEGVANRALAPQAQVQIVAGTVWSGRGVLLPTSGSGANAIPFNWRFDPLALLRLRAGVALSADAAALAGTVKVAFGVRTVEIRDARLRLDASLIATVNGMAALLGPGGMLQLDTQAGEALISTYRGVPLANGNFKLRAENISLRSVSPRAFGNYDLDIVLRETAAEYRITQSSGPLKLDGGGSLKWNTPRQFSYRGIAGAPSDAPEVLAPLRSIGRPMADGRLQIDYQSGW